MSKDFDESKKNSFIEWIDSKESTIDFNIHSQDIKDWGWLTTFIPEIAIESAGGILPFQVEGCIGDYFFYYRERNGVASLNISDNPENRYNYSSALYSSSLDVEEFRSEPQWIETFFNLYENLKKTKILFYFECNEVIFQDKKPLKTGNKTKAPGWGYTQDEAYLEVSSITEYEVDFYSEYMKVSKNDYRDYLKLKEVQNSVISVEYADKIYPMIDQVFKVNAPESWRTSEGAIKIPKDCYM